MTVLDSLDRIVRRGLVSITVALLAAMVVVCFAEVVQRDLAARSFAWYDELVGYLLVWLSYFGAALAQMTGGHIGADAAVRRLPPRLAHGVRVAVQLMLIALHGSILWFGAELALRSLDDRAITVSLPMGVLYAVLPLSSLCFLAIHAAQAGRLLRGEAPVLP